jgi:hypothetical protein
LRRLDDNVIAAFRAQGPGWQSRMNEVLRKGSGGEFVLHPKILGAGFSELRESQTDPEISAHVAD